MSQPHIGLLFTVERILQPFLLRRVAILPESPRPRSRQEHERGGGPKKGGRETISRRWPAPETTQRLRRRRAPEPSARCRRTAGPQRRQARLAPSRPRAQRARRAVIEGLRLRGRGRVPAGGKGGRAQERKKTSARARPTQARTLRARVGGGPEQMLRELCAAAGITEACAGLAGRLRRVCVQDGLLRPACSTAPPTAPTPLSAPRRPPHRRHRPPRRRGRARCSLTRSRGASARIGLS